MLNSIRRSVFSLLLISLGFIAFSQNSVKGDIPNGWHLKDQKSSGYYGISLDKAYEFLKGRKSKQVIVAVIDSGIDTTHEDLKPILWTNSKEIAGNGIDDDRNGYVDDIHGWNFIGGRDGRNVKQNSSEVSRVYHDYKAKFENIKDSTTVSKEDRELYKMWKRAEEEVNQGGDPGEITMLKQIYPMIKNGDSTISKELNKKDYTCLDLKAYKATTRDAIMVKNILMDFCKQNKTEELTNVDMIESLDREIRKAEAATTAPVDYRGEIVKDNKNDINDRYYGNNDLMASTPSHGTHVSGIIAAVRGNGKGMDGIADNVRIMAIRAVPDGDEHDKDVALGIRYAVENGAKIINMSFGKSYSPQKKWVDDAVKFAESKGVLLVHAAGNDGSDLDKDYNYPSPVVEGARKANNWLTVGASGDPKNGGLTAYFSNYGKNEVDVFAPGVNIYSTKPGGNVYGNESGTSMAAPVTSGVAALILEYFPSLTAQQLKYVIEKSSVAPSIKTKSPGTGEDVKLSDLSRTGGVINAFEAVKLAAEIVDGKKEQPVNNKIKVKKTKKA